MDDLTCNVCGGTDFIKEAGYYYCSECQTQTQERQEQEYEIEETFMNIRKTSHKISKSKSSSESGSRLTSWEGYNYIIAGLANELIGLGANPVLKHITHTLWISYLKELELVSTKPRELPKLGAMYTRKDAEIIYHHQQKRKLKTCSDTSTYTTLILEENTDRRQVSREKAKLKRALVKADYATFATATQSSDTSLVNKTLSNVGSSDDESETIDKRIRYNKSARKEFLKHMSATHLTKHINDVAGVLKCHKRFILHKNYMDSPYVISRKKIYSLLYLGLLLSEDDIQLSDVLRFCREGHLSFLSYNHFFPEGLSDKQIDAKLYQKGSTVLPTHDNVRITVFQLQKMLKFEKFDLCPDLKKLCVRYCTELNLPDEIKNMAVNLIDETKPKCQTLIKNAIPNYEGRAMAFILYVLKLLFSLDGVTEFKFSSLADEINETNKFSSKMFVFSDWLKYIEYRKVILKNKSYTTGFLLEHKSINNLDLFVSFLKKRNENEDELDDQHLSMDIVQKLLLDLSVLQDSSYEDYLKFSASFTPMKSDLETVLESSNNLVFGQVIQKDFLMNFSDTSLDYLLNSKQYLKQLYGKNYVIIDKGSNKQCRFTRILSLQDDRSEINFSEYEHEWLDALEKLKFDELSLSKLENYILHKNLKNKTLEQIGLIPDESRQVVLKHKGIDKNLVIKMNNKNNKDKVGRDNKGRFCSLKKASQIKKLRNHKHTPRVRGKWFISAWTENPLLDQQDFNPVHVVTKGKSLESIVKTKINHKENRKRKYEDSDHYVHYRPNMEYWINIADLSNFNRFQWEKLETSLPSTFQWLLNECATVTEQSTRSLFAEFVTVELYITYIHLKKCPTTTESGINNSKDIAKIIKKVSENW